MMPVLDIFESSTEYYPGSKIPIVRSPEPEDLTAPTWDIKANRREVSLKGVKYTLYSIGALAAALNRTPQTIRVWENKRIIPAATITKKSNADKSEHGNRRLYSRKQIEGLIKIAEEEDVLEPQGSGRFKPIRSTDFASRARELFKDLTGDYT